MDFNNSVGTVGVGGGGTGSLGGGGQRGKNRDNCDRIRKKILEKKPKLNNINEEQCLSQGFPKCLRSTVSIQSEAQSSPEPPCYGFSPFLLLGHSFLKDKGCVTVLLVL